MNYDTMSNIMLPGEPDPRDYDEPGPFDGLGGTEPTELGSALRHTPGDLAAQHARECDDAHDMRWIPDGLPAWEGWACGCGWTLARKPTTPQPEPVTEADEPGWFVTPEDKARLGDRLQPAFPAPVANAADTARAALAGKEGGA